jgi:opacity protein-like surface antigen
VRYSRIVAFAILALAAATVPARADGFVTPILGYNFGGDSANCQALTNCEEKHLNFGVSLMAASGIFGFEEDVAYAKNFFASMPGTENNVFTAMSNLTAGVFAGPVQPYVLAGVGLIRSHVSLNPTATGAQTSNAFGYDLGGGINGFFSRSVGIRGDLRHFHTFQEVPILRANLVPQENLDFWRASLGITFRF